MRQAKTFRPLGLDGLEPRIVLSAVGALTAEIAHVATVHEHAPKADHHADHAAHADHHEPHAADKVSK